jgi:prepilin-type processing-associated H-X9-DG protein
MKTHRPFAPITIGPSQYTGGVWTPSATAGSGYNFFNSEDQAENFLIGTTFAGYGSGNPSSYTYRKISTQGANDVLSFIKNCSWTGTFDSDQTKRTLTSWNNVTATASAYTQSLGGGASTDYADLPSITFTTVDRHNGSANYTFSDGHAGSLKYDTVYDNNNWKWGDKVYSLAGTPAVQ